jgi:ribosomal protein S18 acetylase RimI-like enzyme
MLVRRATIADLDLVAPLFDAYRQFYHLPPDIPLARGFIAERLRRGDSTIYLAEDAGKALGFVQLYPLFSSTAAEPGPLWLLNDLYVVPAARGQRVGHALMQQARTLAVESGARGLFLQTARDNLTAQRLYESLGYRRDDQFLVYELDLTQGIAPPP